MKRPKLILSRGDIVQLYDNYRKLLKNLPPKANRFVVRREMPRNNIELGGYGCVIVVPLNQIKLVEQNPVKLIKNEALKQIFAFYHGVEMERTLGAGISYRLNSGGRTIATFIKVFDKEDFTVQILNKKQYDKEFLRVSNSIAKSLKHYRIKLGKFGLNTVRTPEQKFFRLLSLLENYLADKEYFLYSEIEYLKMLNA